MLRFCSFHCWRRHAEAWTSASRLAEASKSAPPRRRRRNRRLRASASVSGAVDQTGPTGPADQDCLYDLPVAGSQSAPASASVSD